MCWDLINGKTIQKREGTLLGHWLVKVLDLGVIIFVVAKMTEGNGGHFCLFQREKMEGKEGEDIGYFDKFSDSSDEYFVLFK